MEPVLTIKDHTVVTAHSDGKAITVKKVSIWLIAFY